MNNAFHLRGAGVPVADHPEFQELCALFATGALTEEEINRLEEHVSECSNCRRYLERFPLKAAAAMEELAPNRAPEASSTESFDFEDAKKRLFGRLPKIKRNDDPPAGGRIEYALAGIPGHGGNGTTLGQSIIFVRSFKPYLPYAAGFFLALGLSLTLYWNGPRRQADEIRLNAGRAENNATASREEAKEFSKQRNALSAQLQDRTTSVLALQSQIAQLRRRIDELEATGSKAAGEKHQLEATQETLSKNLRDEQANVAALRSELNSSHQEHTGDSLRTADLERRIEQLSASVRDQREQIDQQDSEIAQQRDLLAHDRDIRDLMGARQLYVAEVYDSDENGRPKKPYARVFYTKDRSLIFYGFDLDRQPGVRNVGAFQVWGRRGTNRENALNLGILFQDSSTNKRWILKIDDPMKLQQIDAVFVTIEPKGGSFKPTGKPLLFAYLRVDPNHP